MARQRLAEAVPLMRRALAILEGKYFSDKKYGDEKKSFAAAQAALAALKGVLEGRKR